MTVTAAETRVEYAGNGTTKLFSYPYQFFQNDDLDLWLFPEPDGPGIHQILGTDYTVTGAMNPSGGNINMVVAPASGTTLIIINDPDIVQTLHYVNADDFPADSHEQGLDRLTKICQRLSDRIDRAVRAPDYAPEDSVPDADTLVELVDEAKQAAQESSDSAAQSEAAKVDAAASADAAGDQAQLALASATAAASSATAASNSATDAQSSEDDAETAAAAAAASAAAANVAKIEWKGNWMASTAYVLNDAVSSSGSSWISKTSNTNKVPESNPADWDVLAAKGQPGSPGAGTGDMLAANNLSDLTNKATARTNLQLGGSAVLAVGTTANTVAAGDDVRIVHAVQDTGDTMSGPLVNSAKGSQFGNAGGTVSTAAVTSADAGIKFYDSGGQNWAGMGADGAGNVWLRTGITGALLPAWYVGTDQVTYFQGDAKVTKANPTFTLNKTAVVQIPAFVGQSGGLNRWSAVFGDATAEGGSNAGSNFAITAYNDAGAFLGNWLTISRDFGIVTVPYINLTASLGFAGTFYTIATTANFNSGAAGRILTASAVWNQQILPLTDQASVAPDFSLSFDFYWVVGAIGRSLANPTNAKVSQKGIIYLWQDGGGNKTIPPANWGSAWKFAGGVKPTLSTAPNAVDALCYSVYNSSLILCTFIPDVK